MLVSVIIPCFREGRFLDACLKSVRHQSHKALDIIVLDDAGHGDSLGVALTHAKEDRRIRLVKLANNVGLGACRNVGLELARAEWVAFLDGDDILTYRSIEKRIEALEAVLSNAPGSDFAGVYGDWRHITESAMPPENIAPPRTLPAISWAETGGMNQFIVSSPLVKKEVLLKTGGFAERLEAGEDFIAWMKIFAAGHWFAPAPVVTCFYRQKAGSMLRSSAKELAAVAAASIEHFAFAEEQETVSDLDNKPSRESLLDGLKIRFASEKSVPPRGGTWRLRPPVSSTVSEASDEELAFRIDVARTALAMREVPKPKIAQELRQTDAKAWAITGADAEEEADNTLLIVASSPSEIVEAAEICRTYRRPADILISEAHLPFVSLPTFDGLNGSRFVVADETFLDFSKYTDFISFRDWGEAFDAAKRGFEGELPARSTLKPCGFNPFEWKKPNAATYYRFPRMRKLTQGPADHLLLRSRNPDMAGSLILDVFSVSPENQSESFLVVVPPLLGLSHTDHPSIVTWLETVTAALKRENVDYRLGSLCSATARHLLDYGCVSLSFAQLFSHRFMVSLPDDELFFATSSGVKGLAFVPFEDHGGLEFLKNAGVTVAKSSADLHTGIRSLTDGNSSQRGELFCTPYSCHPDISLLNDSDATGRG